VAALGVHDDAVRRKPFAEPASDGLGGLAVSVDVRDVERSPACPVKPIEKSWCE
jgi:hypothetical protein